MKAKIIGGDLYVSIQLPIKGVFIVTGLFFEAIGHSVSIQLPIKGVFIEPLPDKDCRPSSFNPTPY